jgi:hypothetical protein
MTDLRIPDRTPEEAQRAVDGLTERHSGWRIWRWAERPASLLRAAQEQQESKHHGR